MILATLRHGSDDRLVQTLMGMIKVSSLMVALGADVSDKFRCFVIAAGKVANEVEAAKYVRFLRSAREDAAVREQGGRVLEEAERAVLSRFSEDGMQMALLTVEVMDE